MNICLFYIKICLILEHLLGDEFEQGSVLPNYHGAIQIYAKRYRSLGIHFESEVAEILARGIGGPHSSGSSVTTTLEICGMSPFWVSDDLGGEDAAPSKGTYLDGRDRMVVTITAYDMPGSGAIKVDPRHLQEIWDAMKEKWPDSKLDIRLNSYLGNHRLYDSPEP